MSDEEVLEEGDLGGDLPEDALPDEIIDTDTEGGITTPDLEDDEDEVDFDSYEDYEE
ncbi:MAG: hypothetical protein QG665_54 [Patescibacteria group bacterium]|nr:hypothetical protein [Patescibacteria group bacterium]